MGRKLEAGKSIEMVKNRKGKMVDIYQHKNGQEAAKRLGRWRAALRLAYSCTPDDGYQTGRRLVIGSKVHGKAKALLTLAINLLEKHTKKKADQEGCDSN